MKNEIEVHVKIPDGYSLKGCRTDGDTAIAIFTPVISHRVIGFAPSSPEGSDDEEEECLDAMQPVTTKTQN